MDENESTGCNPVIIAGLLAGLIIVGVVVVVVVGTILIAALAA